MTRPKYATRKDRNANIALDFLKYGCGGFSAAPKELVSNVWAYTANYRGHSVMYIDYSNIGGIIPDGYISVNGHTAWAECKTKEAYKEKDHGMTTGELWMYENCKEDFYIYTDEEEFIFIIDELIG